VSAFSCFSSPHLDPPHVFTGEEINTGNKHGLPPSVRFALRRLKVSGGCPLRGFAPWIQCPPSPARSAHKLRLRALPPPPALPPPRLLQARSRATRKPNEIKLPSAIKKKLRTAQM
jgi:hypothetical protein